MSDLARLREVAAGLLEQHALLASQLANLEDDALRATLEQEVADAAAKADEAVLAAQALEQATR
jgi:hypothetical protein